MQGGDLFHRARQADGTPYHYDVAGLWGSGNVVTERELRPDDNTLYTMWTGEGLLGPRAGELLEPYPAVLGRQTLRAFLDQFGDAGIECLVLIGDEPPSSSCAEPCDRIRDLCGPNPGQSCLEQCDPERAGELAACLTPAQTCEDAQTCWESQP